MGVGTQIAVAAGTQTEDFDPIIAPIMPVGDRYTAHVACNPGTLHSWRSAGSAQPVPVNQDGRSVWYLGFVAQQVISSTAYPIEVQFGYRSVLDVDLVSIWQFGRFRIPFSDSSATIAEGDLVYPSKNTAGYLADLANTATDGTHACPAVGRCIVAPTTAGGGITVEVALIANGAQLG